jgi:hypothetical protein
VKIFGKRGKRESELTDACVSMRDTVRAPLAVKTNPATPSLQVFVSALAITTKHTHQLHAAQDFLHFTHTKSYMFSTAASAFLLVRTHRGDDRTAALAG